VAAPVAVVRGFRGCCLRLLWLAAGVGVCGSWLCCWLSSFVAPERLSFLAAGALFAAPVSPVIVLCDRLAAIGAVVRGSGGCRNKPLQYRVSMPLWIWMTIKNEAL